MDSTKNPYAPPVSLDSGDSPALAKDIAYRVEGNVVYTHRELDIRGVCFWTGTTDVQRRSGQRMIADLSLIDKLVVALIPWCLAAIGLSVVVSESGRYFAGVMVVIAHAAGCVAWIFIFFRGPQVTVRYGLPRRARESHFPLLVSAFFVGLFVTSMFISVTALQVRLPWNWVNRMNFPAVFFASALCCLMIRWRFKRPLSASKTAEDTFRVEGLPAPLLRALNERQHFDSAVTK